MGDWKPIETAPKDGTWIVLYQKGIEPIPYDFANWVTERDGKWVMVEETQTRILKEFVIEDRGYWNCELVYAPTHWKELETPPSE